ncbi:hypothetical protein GQ457_04G025740 [Hibiscus cannabinus]
MTAREGEFLGNQFGSSIATDLRDGDGLLGDFLRIHAEINCGLPLCRFIAIGKDHSGKPRIFPIQYERLPKFCFFCGIIGHDTEHCSLMPKDDVLEFQFRPWLKVDFTKSSHDSARRAKSGIVLTKKGVATTDSTRMYRAEGNLTVWSNRYDREKKDGTENMMGKRPYGRKDGENPQLAATIVFLSETRLFKNKVDSIRRQLDHSHKAEDWNLLDNLRHRSQLPRLLGEDLNAILCRDEKEGGRRNPRSEMGAFRDALECNGLWDIKPNKDTDGPIVSRGSFDDYFKFDSCWANEHECEDIVRNNWMALNCSTREKLKHLGADLAVWQSKRRRRAVRRRNALQSRIDHLLVQPITKANVYELRSSKKELHRILTRDEHYWRQRSRVQWLKEGDHNSSFFHARAKGRRKNNFIKGITDISGQWVEEGEDNIFEVSEHFYTNLFRSANGLISNMIMKALETCITPEMNVALCSGFTAEEVQKAFFQIHPHKAPG